MATLRELKARIGSVASSEKITGAMKMISSAKMHKVEGVLRRLQPYRSQVETVIKSLLSSDANFESPLITPREANNCALIVWGSDDGLCGAYNANLAKKIPECIAKITESAPVNAKITLIAVGSKMFKVARRYAGDNLSVETVEGINSKSEGDDLRKFLNIVKQWYTDGRFDRIEVLYMNFVSASRQRPTISTFLPLIPEKIGASTEKVSVKPYIFEPNATTLFDTVIPMYLLAVTEDIFNENRASEQAARVMAMQSANDNAKKLLDQLRLEYNKLRQQAITNELLDIVGGQIK